MADAENGRPTLTRPQHEILEFIIKFRDDHGGISPTLREIGSKTGRAATTVKEHIDQLVDKGLIERRSSVSRGLVPTVHRLVRLEAVHDLVDELTIDMPCYEELKTAVGSLPTVL